VSGSDVKEALENDRSLVPVAGGIG
jgi:hypothetical protein